MNEAAATPGIHPPPAPAAGSRARRRAGTAPTSKRWPEMPRWASSLIGPLIVGIITGAVSWGALRQQVAQVRDDNVRQDSKLDDISQRLSRIEGALGVSRTTPGGGAP